MTNDFRASYSYKANYGYVHVQKPSIVAASASCIVLPSGGAQRGKFLLFARGSHEIKPIVYVHASIAIRTHFHG